MSRAMLILIAGDMASETRMLALALANSAHDVMIVGAGTRLEPVELPPLVKAERLRSYERFEHEYPLERVRDSTPREVAHLWRENLWREKRNRSMFNARVRGERRAMKKARGIGRR